MKKYLVRTRKKYETHFKTSVIEAKNPEEAIKIVIPDWAEMKDRVWTVSTKGDGSSYEEEELTNAGVFVAMARTAMDWETADSHAVFM